MTISSVFCIKPSVLRRLPGQFLGFDGKEKFKTNKLWQGGYLGTKEDVSVMHLMESRRAGS